MIWIVKLKAWILDSRPKGEEKSDGSDNRLLRCPLFIMLGLSKVSIVRNLRVSSKQFVTDCGFIDK